MDNIDESLNTTPSTRKQIPKGAFCIILRTHKSRKLTSPDGKHTSGCLGAKGGTDRPESQGTSSGDGNVPYLDHTDPTACVKWVNFVVYRLYLIKSD